MIISFNTFILIFSILFTHFIKLSNAGSITSWDIDVDYTNLGLTKNYYLYFSLENGLGLNHYMRIIWPFNLGFLTTWQIGGYWGEISPLCAPPNTNNTIEIKKSSIPSDSSLYAYHIRFNTQSITGTYQYLNPNQMYMMNIQALNTPSTSGPQGIIQLSTVSLPGDITDTNYIIFDSNSVFSTLQIMPAPTTTLTASLTSTDSNKNNIAQASYIVIFDITPTVAIPNGYRISIETTNHDFNFVSGSCTNIANTALNINPYGTFTNFYSQGKVILQSLFPLQSSIPMRFQCQLSNPNYVGTSGLIFRTMPYQANTIIETITLATGLSTVSMTWGPLNTYYKVYLGWGMDFTSSTLATLPDAFGIYKSYSATSIVYNTIKFGFIPSANTPLGIMLTLTLQTMASPNFFILQSTLIHNLPNAYGTLSTCSITSPGITNTIICIGVGPLSINDQYFISFKFYIISTATETTVGANFGTLSATDYQNRVIIQAYTPSLASTSIITNKQTYFLNINNPSDVNFRANQLVHTVPSGGTVSSTQYGIYKPVNPTTTILDLVFEHSRAQSDVTSGSFATGSGCEYFTTPQIFLGYTYTSSQNNNNPNDCSGTSLTSGNTNWVVCQAVTVGNIVNTPSRYYTRIRFSPANSYSSIWPVAQTLTSLRIQNMVINKTSSVMFADDGIFDFYGRGVANALTIGNINTDPLGTAQSTLLINSYCIEQGNLANINIGLSMFWTGTTANLAGNMFPAYIRITGYFSNSERNVLQRLSIFFNGLNYFQEADGSVPCSSLVGALECNGTLGHNYRSFNPFMMNRVDVDISQMVFGTSSTNPFQIIIPVSTITNTYTITLGVAVLSKNTKWYSEKGFFNSPYLLSFGETDYTTLVNNPNDITQNINSAYVVRKPAGVTIGQVVTATDFPNLIALTGNSGISGANIWAGDSYCGTWKWYGSSTFTLSSIPKTTGTSPCSFVDYLDNTGQRHYCSYCPIETTLNTVNSPKQQTTSFTFPYFNGADMPNAYLTFSTNTGVLKAYGNDGTGAAMATSTRLIIYNLTSHPSVLYSGVKNYRIYIQFSTSVGFNSDGYVIIKAVGPNLGWTYGSTAQGYFDNTPCTLSPMLAIGFYCQLSGGTTDWQSGDHNLTITGVDVYPSASGTINFQVSVQTSTLALIEMTDPYNPSSFVISSSASIYKLNLQNLGLFIQNQLSKSVLSFDFLASKYTFANEQYVFNLGSTLNTQQATNPVYCQVYAGQQISWNFKQCIVSDLTQLQLIPLSEFWPNSLINDGFLTIKLFNLIIPSTLTETISGILERQIDSANVQTQASTLSYPVPLIQATISSGSLTLIKKYSRPGSITELIFTYTPTQGIQNPTTIYIEFPPYYPSGLGYNTTSCQINNDPVYCTRILPNWLIITYFLRNYASGSSYQITVFGIRQPVVSTLGNIFFAVSFSGQIGTIDQSTSILDVQTTQPAFILLNAWNLTIQTPSILTFSDYNITFKTESTSISNSIIVITFPDRYGNLLQVPQYKPTCYLMPLSTPTYDQTKISGCTALGSRLKMTLISSLDPNTYYLINILSVRNPDTTLCKVDKFIVSIVTTDETQILYESHTTTFNANWTSYTQNASLTLLQWSINPISQQMVYPIQMTVGVYSQPICLMPNDNRFIKTVNITLDPTDIGSFQAYPSNLLAYTGQYSSCFRIASNETYPPSIYDIKFIRNEVFQPLNYTNVSRLSVKLSPNPIIISTNELGYNIPPSGNSVPIVFDLMNYPPQNTLVIHAVLSNNYFNFTELDFISLNVTNPKGYFIIHAHKNATIGQTCTLSFTMTGVNSNSYNIQPSSVGIIVIAPSMISQTDFSVAVNFTTNKTIVYQQISLTSNIPCTIYYYVSIQNTFSRTCGIIKDNSLTFVQYYNLDPAQEQYGFTYTTEYMLNTQITINNLRSAQKYNFYLCGETQQGYWMQQKIIPFTAPDNNVKIIKLNFTFNGTLALNTMQEIDFACFLASQFQLLEYNVISENGISCEDKYTSAPLPEISKPLPMIYTPYPLDLSSAVYKKPTTSRLLTESTLQNHPSLHHPGLRQSILTNNTSKQFQSIYQHLYKRSLQTTTSSSSSSTTTPTGDTVVKSLSIKGIYPIPVLWNLTSPLNTIDTSAGGALTNLSYDYTLSFGLFYILYGNSETILSYDFELIAQNYMLGLDPTNTGADLYFLNQINAFRNNYTGGFPKVTYGSYVGQINTLTPGFTSYPPPVIISGSGWIAVNWIKLSTRGYVYAIAVETGPGPNLTTNTSKTSTIISSTQLKRAPSWIGTPNSIQIKNNLTSNDTLASGGTSIYLTTTQIGMLNISGLGNYTTYSIFYFCTNEDLSRFAESSTIVNVSGNTLIIQANNTFGSKLTLSMLLLLIIYAKYLIN